MPKPINDSDDVTRYIYQKSHFARCRNIVKYGAFMPNVNEDSIAMLSVYMISNIDEQQIRDLADQYVTPFQNGRSLKCRADIQSRYIHENELELEYNEPPPNHLNIKKWPQDTNEQMQIAMELAGKSRLILN